MSLFFFGKFSFPSMVLLAQFTFSTISDLVYGSLQTGVSMDTLDTPSRTGLALVWFSLFGAGFDVIVVCSSFLFRQSNEFLKGDYRLVLKTMLIQCS
jgi:hypothetical protein